MRKFIVKIIRFSLVGIFLVLIAGVLYLSLDPFKVLKDYESFFNSKEKATVVLDKDYVSTTTFIKNSKKINYNSFILGNSRSMFYQIQDWKRHIGQNAIAYHFDGSGEALWALNKKVEFIDKNGNNIDNMLLIFDYSILKQDKPKNDNLSIISPALVDNKNIVKFHLTFFKTFLNPKFLSAFLDYKFSSKYKPYMKQILDDRQKKYDVKTNEIRFDYFEELILQDKYFTPERLRVFYERDTTIQVYSPKCIYNSQKNMLKNISLIANKHNTKLRIVISPLYNQQKLNEADLKYLKSLFGEANVFDFSGINKFTNNYKNYYESSHYRPHVAREIMEIIYDEHKARKHSNVYNE